MEIEYKSKLLWSGLQRPFGKRFLIAIPMYMYRINTYTFERGFNFFQKVVLKLKVNPGITNSTISEILGLPDDKLVTKVERQLKRKNLLGETGLITSEGLLVREKSDGFIVDKDNEKLGYIFQMVNQEIYYSNYVDHIQDVAFKKRNGTIKVNVFTDEFGEDKYSDAHILDIEPINLPKPSEKVIIQAINNKSWLDMEDKGQEHSHDEKSSDFNIEFVSEKPELVWVCTYVYLPRLDGVEDVYDSNWRVLDPFGYGDSVKLKFYLEGLQNKDFQDKLDSVFSNVVTTASQKYSELKKQLESMAEDNIMQDFGLESHLLDKNIQQYLSRAVFYFYSLKNEKFNDSGDSQDFIINVQQLLEAVFKLDRERRADIYSRVDSVYFPNRDTLRLYDTKDRKTNREVNSIISKRISDGNYICSMKFSTATRKLPKGIFEIILVRDFSLKALKWYLPGFILSHHRDFMSSSPLLPLVNGNLEKIVDIANERNDYAHGKTEKEGAMSTINEEKATSIYSFLKEFVNGYINIKY